MDLPQRREFLCPACKGEIEFSADGSYSCLKCNRHYLQKDSVYDFSLEEIFWGEIDNEKASVLLSRAREKGYKAAVNELLSDNPDLITDFLENQRANAIYLLAHRKDAVVMDLGAGWGVIATQAAKVFRKIYAVEAVDFRASFLRLRLKQEAIDNVSVVKASIFNLPFPPESFDIIIMNGVLEWLGEWAGSDNPYKIQLQTLKELRSLLKANGQILIGIENRFGYNYFLYGRKDHNNLWGTNLLPRRLANIISQYRLKKPYRIYTHSYKGLQKLLLRAGFKKWRFFAPLPGYTIPFTIIDLQDYQPLKFYFENQMIKDSLVKRFFFPAGRLFLKFGMLKYFVPDFLILAQK